MPHIQYGHLRNEATSTIWLPVQYGCLYHEATSTIRLPVQYGHLCIDRRTNSKFAKR